MYDPLYVAAVVGVAQLYRIGHHRREGDTQASGLTQSNRWRNYPDGVHDVSDNA